MEAKTEEIIHGVVDVVAAHNLLQYVTGPSNDEALRMVAGGTLTALGYAYGPELRDRFRKLKGEPMTEQMRKQIIYSAGGALLGGIIAYVASPDIFERREGTNFVNLPKPNIREQPSGLLTIGSAAWIGYSLLMRSNDPEWKERQYWGLGAGSIGYMTGPTILSKIKDLAIPTHIRDDALERFSRGAAALGMIGGAGIGHILAKGDSDEHTRQLE